MKLAKLKYFNPKKNFLNKKVFSTKISGQTLNSYYKSNIVNITDIF